MRFAAKSFLSVSCTINAGYLFVALVTGTTPAWAFVVGALILIWNVVALVPERTSTEGR
jgi:hypothetical protein